MVAGPLWLGRDGCSEGGDILGDRCQVGVMWGWERLRRYLSLCTLSTRILAAIYANTRYLHEYSLFTRVHAKYSLSTRILAEYTLSEYVEYMLNLRACPCHNFTVPCAY